MTTDDDARKPPKNPYGGRPGGGIALPEYFKPTKYITGSRSQYFPLIETIGPDEMRVSFMGSTPFPPCKDQAGTCIMVELGNGDRFFFDFGSGCVRNIIAMQIAPAMINNVFQTHLHVDHYADVPYPRVDGRLHAVSRDWPVRPNPGAWHKGHVREHDENDEVAYGGV